MSQPGAKRRVRAWWSRLAGAVITRRRAREFDEEMAAHLALETDELVRRGLSPENARRQALIAAGGIPSAREAYRDRAGIPAVDALGQDLRFALRMVRKSPAFTAAAVLVLALGIGANGAVFSLINALLIRPLNAGALDAELIGVFSGERSRADRFRMFSYPEYVDIRDGSDLFQGLLAESGTSAGITANGRTTRVRAMLVSSNYFSVLGARMAAGRGFTSAEEDPRSGAAVAVVSYAYWRQRGLATDLIGSRVTINGSDLTIVGVAGDGFYGTLPVMSTDVWLPFGATRLVAREEGEQRSHRVDHDRSAQVLLLTGTLKPAVSFEQAEARLAPLADGLAAAYPQFNKDQRLVVRPRSRTGRGPFPRADTAATAGATTLMALAGLVLFVACLNLANMLLARGGGRRQEIAVRLALGGGRFRIVRQLVVEGLLLALMGGAAALALSWWVAARFVAILREILLQTTVALDVSPDATVVAIIIAAAVVSTIVFSLGPAWRLSKPDLAMALKQSTAAEHRRTGRVSLPGALVAAQIAASLVLLIVAGVFTRSGAHAASSDPGFGLAGGLIVETDTALIGLGEAEGRQAYATALARVRALTGVLDASVASIVPFGSRSEGRLIRRESGADQTPLFTTLTVVGSRYFASLGLPILAGRDFTDAEERGAGAPVAIVDRLFAERLFGSGSAVGRFVPTMNWDGGPGGIVQIVGIVPTVRDEIVEAPDRAHLYLPFGNEYRSQMLLHVRVGAGAEARMTAQVDDAMQRADTPLPIVSMRTLTEHRDGSAGLWAVVFTGRLFAAFGLIALTLATVGVYGLRAYLVARRTREIGIRIALGATRGGIVSMLLHESARVAIAGFAAGVALAIGLVLVLRQSGMIVYDLNPLDPLTFAGAPLLLALVVAVASYIPARRALRIDPAVALRPE